MSTNDIHAVEPGWSVRTSDGSAVGSIEQVTETSFLVKSGLINAEHRHLPLVTLEHVHPEEREIVLSLSKDEVEAGDWSQPPAEGPRADGPPLNDTLTTEVGSRVVTDDVGIDRPDPKEIDQQRF